MPTDPRREADDQDQQTFLEQLLVGSPDVVAERALRIAYTTARDNLRLRTEFDRDRTQRGEFERRTAESLERIERRLGTLEDGKKSQKPPAPPESGSMRPATFRDMRALVGEALQTEAPKILGKIEQDKSDRRWLGFRDWVARTVRRGVNEGATKVVAIVVFTLGVLAIGYALNDVLHAAVRQGLSREPPHRLAPPEK